MARIIKRLLPLLLLVCFYPGSAGAQQPDRPPNLDLGDAVVTGFSGTLAPDASKPRPANKSAIDLTFIDPDGPSARIVDLSRPGYVWDGRLFQAPKTFDVFAKDVGQVFGVALDDETPPNIYLAATSVFGLNIVRRGRDGAPERRKKGGPGAGWMKGQFGLDLQGGPGGIYKVDGRTGAVTLFANVTLDGVPNPAPGLGNLAYDAAHKQLFVSDLYTGMIHRFDLDGRELGHFDHGVTALAAAKLATVPFNPRNRPNIASERFDSENPNSWGYAPAARRVWGLAVHDGRLYYSVVSGPQIWSVGIERDGNFAADARWELDVPAQAGPLPISDIAFSQKGAMILAQRALIAGAYDYAAFTRPGEPRVLRYWLKDPNDPPSPGRWKPAPEEYAVGFAGTYRNGNGGVALGYGYGADGTLQPAACEAALWSTGQNLRNNPALRSQLDPGGPLLVHGLQGSPADMVRGANEPPATSYFIDYDDKFDDARAAGHLGSVRILTQPCAGAVAVSGPAVVASPAGGGGGGDVCYPPNQPTSLSLPPRSLPPCTQPGQPVSLDLSTVVSYPGVDPNWAVTPFGPQGHSTAPYFGWTTLANRWIQPKQFNTVQNHPVSPPSYVYTRKFNLPNRPECYRKLQLCGQYGSDNSSVVTLNALTNIVATSSNSYSSPAVSFCAPTSFFVPGLNVLTVTVQNALPVSHMNPTGMAMIAKLEAICGPDCVCECPPGTVNKDGTCVPTNPIDLKIDKEDTPGGGGGTWFNVWVTNVGPPITFPAGGITIDEVVPTGMTVTGVTGTGWTCLPLTIVGPGTMHCTYNLAGSLGTGVSLSSTMVVHYTTTGPGPFRNCAIVGIGSSVGVDTNPSNDMACADVTPTQGTLSVTKIVSPDPRGIGNTLTFPIVATCTNPNATYNLNVNGNTSTLQFALPVGSICSFAETQPALPAGCTWLAPIFSPANVPIVPGLNLETVTNGYRCREVCPDGEVLVDGKCVTPIVCQPPQIMIPGVGCMCPDGMELVDGKCVKHIVCDPPLVPNADGTKCVCRDGLVLRRGKCVQPEKSKPSKTCKRDFVWNGDMCVKRKTEPRQEDRREQPGIRLPGFNPGGGQGGGGSGGHPGGATPSRR